jgi:acid phosphatase
LKKALSYFVLAVGLAAGWSRIAAQQPTPSKQPAPATPPVAASNQPVLRFAPVAPGERIPNLQKFTDELKQYHECTCKCGCYGRDLNLQSERAIAFLRRRAAHGAKEHKLAVVLDIDETTLSNYPEMLKTGFVFNQKESDAWIDAGSAKAIPGTLNIYNEAKKLGATVFFLTGRGESLREATERNLRAEGFDGWQQLIMREAGQAGLTALAYKSAARREIVRHGYRIVLNVGDQWSDLQGIPEAEYSVKYPNPYYFIR